MTSERVPTVDLTAGAIGRLCRRDRTPERLPLAAAAGDPVALSALGTQLTVLRPVHHLRAAVEVLSVRRPDRLDRIAAEWPDAASDFDRPEVWTAWAVALRHLHRNGHVDPGAAALRGPLRDEAVRCGVVTTDAGVPTGRWSDYCDRVRRRKTSFDELRTIGRVGFGDDQLDAAPLVGLDPTMLRPLRGRWGDAIGLEALLAATDLERLGPWGLAVWWEAADATQGADRAERMGSLLSTRLASTDDPARWWPAVLAFLTDWRTP